jgi:hypothetical protein
MARDPRPCRQAAEASPPLIPAPFPARDSTRSDEVHDASIGFTFQQSASADPTRPALPPDIANRWNETVGITTRYPDDHAGVGNTKALIGACSAAFFSWRTRRYRSRSLGVRGRPARRSCPRMYCRSNAFTVCQSRRSSFGWSIAASPPRRACRGRDRRGPSWLGRYVCQSHDCRTPPTPWAALGQGPMGARRR